MLYVGIYLQVSAKHLTTFSASGMKAGYHILKNGAKFLLLVRPHPLESLAYFLVEADLG